MSFIKAPSPTKEPSTQASTKRIVDEEFWEKVNAQLELRSRAQRGKVHGPQVAPFAGLLYCTECSNGMRPTFTTRHGRRYKYYSCQAARRKRNKAVLPDSGWGEGPGDFPAPESGTVARSGTNWEAVLQSARDVSNTKATRTESLLHSRMEREWNRR